MSYRFYITSRLFKAGQLSYAPTLTFHAPRPPLQLETAVVLLMKTPPFRVRVNSSTVGTGTSVALDAAATTKYLTPVEAGMVHGSLYDYVIELGNDIEYQVSQAYNFNGPAIARGTPVLSKIGGVLGTAQLTLNGGQRVVFPAVPETFNSIFNTARAWTATQSATVQTLTSGVGPLNYANQIWYAVVEGTTFIVANPQSVAVNDKAVYLLLIKFNAPNLVAFGTAYKVTGYTPSLAGVDALSFVYDATSGSYWLVGVRNRIDL